MSRNTFFWLLVCGVVTLLLLLIFGIQPSVYTGIICSVAFFIGVTSQQFPIFNRKGRGDHEPS
jgi:MFS superfamily sulfate permease-like transporter